MAVVDAQRGALQLSRYEAVKLAFHRWLHRPTTDLLVAVLILVSVVLIVLETVEGRDSPLRVTLEELSDLITWAFIVELSLRFWVAPKKSVYFRRYWIDLLSVLPVIRPLRLLRVLRLLRLFRLGLILNRRFSLLRGAISGATTELMLLGTVTTVLVLAGAITLYLAERTVGTGFASLPQATWFSIYSLIAGEPVGGEPVTLLGRVITLTLMLGGLTVFGMFVGTISATMVGRLSQRMEVNPMDVDDLSGHIIICGWNHAGPLVVEEMMVGEGAEDLPVVIITEAEGLPEDLPLDRLRRELLYHVSGDYTRVEVLEQAAVSRASKAILLSDKTQPRSDQDRDARTVLAALTVERLCPGIFTCAELRSRQNEGLLRRSGVEEIVIADEYSGFILGSVGRTSGLVATFDEILSARYGNAFHKVTVGEAQAGQSIGDLHRSLKKEHDAVLVSLERMEAGSPKVTVNPPSELVVNAGDALVVIARRPVKL
ncbi:MAG: NAD-binding protein [Deltaproteobacteria bacterium]|nr:NAD-binding protein [Deltaproteobacteria bacterium]